MKKYWVVQCAPENYYNIYLFNNGEWEWARNNKYSGRARNGAVQCFDKMKKGDKALCFVSKRQIFTDILEVMDKIPNQTYKEILSLKLDRQIFITLENIINTIPNHLLKRHDKGYFSFIESHTARQGTFYALTKEQFELICELDEEQALKKYERIFTTRHETGEQAEKIFQTHYAKIPLFADTKPNDMRPKGVGYDFEISKGKERYFVEVKGIKDGGISRVLFTPKEWKVAKQSGKNYILVVVNLAQKTMQVVQNPSQAKESAKRSETAIYDVDIKPLCDKKNLYTIII